MRKSFIVIMVVGFVVGVLMALPAQAGVTIKVRALNPLDSQEKASIYYPLPKEITLEHIIDQKVIYSMDPVEGEEPRKTKLSVTLDEKVGGYFLNDEVMLKPKEIVTVEVYVKDVWEIDPSVLDAAQEEALRLVEQWGQGAPGSDPGSEEEREEASGIVTSLSEGISEALKGIRARQAASTIAQAGVEKHIEAYQKNVEALDQVQQDIAMLKNVIGVDEKTDGEEESAGAATQDAESTPGIEDRPEAEEIRAQEEKDIVSTMEALPEREALGDEGAEETIVEENISVPTSEATGL